jgi:hypothetical protein
VEELSRGEEALVLMPWGVFSAGRDEVCSKGIAGALTLAQESRAALHAPTTDVLAASWLVHSALLGSRNCIAAV